MEKAWIIWLAIAAVAFFAEVMSGTVALLCVALGALCGMVAALCGATLLWQAAIAALAALATFFILGPMLQRIYTRRPRRQEASNMDALTGRRGRVTQTVTADYTDGGRVQVDGDSWQAWTAADHAPILPGTVVIVESHESIVVRVRPETQPQ